MKHLLLAAAAAACLSALSLAQVVQQPYRPDISPELRPTPTPQQKPLSKITKKDGTTVSCRILVQDSFSVYCDFGEERKWIQLEDIKEIEELPSCPLGYEQSPEIRGIRLGQTLDHLRARFPKNRELADAGAAVSASVTVTDFKGRAEFNGVLGFQLGFLDQKLVAFSVYYPADAKWESQEQFKTVAAQRLNLPATGWQGTGPLVLFCEGFKVHTMTVPSGQVIKVLARDLDKELQRRFDAAEKTLRDAQEQQRQGFKP